MLCYQTILIVYSTLLACIADCTRNVCKCSVDIVKKSPLESKLKMIRKYHIYPSYKKVFLLAIITNFVAFADCCQSFFDLDMN